MNEENNQDYVMIFEAPKIEPPEFRLYYEEDTGKILFYTCEKPEGKFIVVDSLTFALARYDIKVVDGRIESLNLYSTIKKLVVSDSGIRCLKEDLSIVVTEDTDAEVQYMKLDSIN